MSSANLSTLLDYVIFQIIYIYIKNSIGPNTDPCGTPLKTDFQFKISPSTITLLSVSYFFIIFYKQTTSILKFLLSLHTLGSYTRDGHTFSPVIMTNGDYYVGNIDNVLSVITI